MNRQPISVRALFEYSPEERTKAVKVCLAMSLLCGIVAGVVYLLSRIGTTDDGTLRLYGVLGCVVGVTLFSFLVLSLVAAVGQRIYARRRPPPPPAPPSSEIPTSRWGD